jgi:hypothetical protein
LGLALGIAGLALLFRGAWLFVEATIVVALLFWGLFAKALRRDELAVARIDPASVRYERSGTIPRTWGVYRIVRSRSDGVHTKSEYRFGTHPVRHRELERTFGEAELVGLFRSRLEAEQYSILIGE